jgi:hypothetical protein
MPLTPIKRPGQSWITASPGPDYADNRAAITSRLTTRTPAVAVAQACGQSPTSPVRRTGTGHGMRLRPPAVKQALWGQVRRRKQITQFGAACITQVEPAPYTQNESSLCQVALRSFLVGGSAAVAGRAGMAGRRLVSGPGVACPKSR